MRCLSGGRQCLASVNRPVVVRTDILKCLAQEALELFYGQLVLYRIRMEYYERYFGSIFLGFGFSHFLGNQRKEGRG